MSRSFVLALFCTCLQLAFGQSISEDLSFGHKRGISTNSFSIPGWSMLGEGHVPQILSDKVILTPPVGGNKRGALWTEKQNKLQDWVVDVEFRAGGIDRSSGNMQLWYVKDGNNVVSTSSIYTTGKFDGFALVVDTAGGVQKVRGFLNDGNTDYKSHPMIESLAFGHCDYNYRNLGRPSKIQIRSTRGGLEVTVDDKKCFSTPKVVLPTDYNFGITAASSDPPDSFEVFKFVTSSASPATVQQGDQPAAQQGSVPIPAQEQQHGNTIPEPKEIPASHFTTSDAQFEDLHSRLHLLSKSITNLFNEIQRHTQAEEARFNEILRQLPNAAMIGNLESRVTNIDRLVTDLSRDVKNSDHKTQFDRISKQIEKTQEGITEHLPGRMREYVQNHTPRIGFMLFSFMAFQSLCLAVLLFQKYRKATMPKKFM